MEKKKKEEMGKGEIKEDATFAYAQMVPNLQYKDIPSEAIEAIKMDILDTLAAILSGSSAEGTRELLDQVTYWGGREESSFLVYGDKVPSLEAAMVNSQMAHARDYDDVYHLARIHVGAVNVPTGLAISEKIGKVSGTELITAILIGVDIEIRLAQAAKLWTQFHPTATYGYFGACATAGRLLGLNAAQMLNAFGIAYSQASGNKQCIHDGSFTKRLQPGLASRGGILAAHLAQRGYTGTKNNFEGQAGLFALYHGGQYDPEPLTKDLGKYFDVVRLGYKPYPCAVCNHTAIEASLALVKENNIKPEQIKEVIIGVNSGSIRLCEPVSVKHYPRNVVDLQFSIPYNVANVIINRKSGLEHYSEKAFDNLDVLEFLATKIKSWVDPEVDFDDINKGSPAARIQIKTKDGNLYVKRVDYPKGHHTNPMSVEEIIEKFWYCAEFLARPIAKQKLKKVVELVTNLEKVPDITSVVKLLT